MENEDLRKYIGLRCVAYDVKYGNFQYKGKIFSIRPYELSILRDDGIQGGGDRYYDEHGNEKKCWHVAKRNGSYSQDGSDIKLFVFCPFGNQVVI